MDEDSSDESGSEEKLDAVVRPAVATEELEEDVLVASYLEKVTPGIAREFKVL